MIFAEPMPAIERWRIHARLDYFLFGAKDKSSIGSSVRRYEVIDQGRSGAGPEPWKEPGRAP